MLVLLAEDNVELAELLIHLLKKEGHQIDHAIDGAEALMYADLNTYDIIILDWMMPEVNGKDVCQRLRSKNYDGGILMLTAKDSLDDKVLGLESGADDYIIKPFEFREFLARMKALSRRSSKSIKPDIVIKGDFSLDRSFQKVTYKSEDIEFSKREYQLFCLLFENANRTVPRELIIDRIWGIDGDVSTNNLDAFIRLLRKKMTIVCDRKMIKNVRGIGYKLEA